MHKERKNKRNALFNQSRLVIEPATSRGGSTSRGGYTTNPTKTGPGVTMYGNVTDQGPGVQTHNPRFVPRIKGCRHMIQD
jgi:hypothetical protein